MDLQISKSARQGFALLLMSVLAITACSKTKSSNVKTDGVYAIYTIEGNNQGSATCRAQFQVGGSTGTYLDLESGDTVTCQGKAMMKEEFAGIITYTTVVDYNPGANYSVTFRRSGEPSYTAFVTLPQPIVGANPSTAGASYQKGRPLTVTWTPSSASIDQMAVGLSAQTDRSVNFRNRSGGSPEVGTVSFNGEDTQENPSIIGNVSATISFQRTRTGAMPSGLNGRIQAQQVFRVPVQLID